MKIIEFKNIILFVFCVFCVPFFAIADVEQKETQGLVYYLYTPSTYDSSKTYPFVVAFHWSTGRGTDMIERWKAPADKYGFIVACPNSRDISAWDTSEDKEILRMIEDIRKNYPIGSKILVTGFSGGGMFAYHLGLNYPKVFTALAPIAGSLRRLMEYGLDISRKSKKIPVFIMHGTADSMIDIKESYFARDELIKYGYIVKFQELGGLSHEYKVDMSWPIAQWFERL